MAQPAKQVEMGEERGSRVLRAWLVETHDFGPHGSQDRLVEDGLEERAPQAVGLRPILPKLVMNLGRFGLTISYMEKGTTPKSYLIPAARIRRLELE